MYRIADGDVVGKWRIEFYDADGKEHAFEWLGRGRYYNIDGLHPSGEPYKWHDPHPCEIGADNIPVVTAKQSAEVRNRIHEYIDVMGFTLKASSGGGAGSSADAKKIGDGDVAPTAQLVLDLLAAVPCNDETFQSRDEFVNVLRAIKASLGSAHREHWPAVLEWALHYPGSEPDYIEKIWESFDDSALGWSYLSAWAHGHGFSGDAQHDFANDQEIKPEPVSAVTENRTGAEIPDIPGPEVPLERALKRCIWCVGLGQFYDTVTGEYWDKDRFNSMETDIEKYGRSGIQSAAGQFLNAEGARKVHTATYLVGEPLIVQQGKKQALNLWRASDFEPATNVSDDAVRPWREHMRLIFGDDDSPSMRHILDVLSFWVQKPGKKVNHAIAIYGATQGTGKDSCFEPLVRFLGAQNIQNVTPEMISSQFNDFLCAQMCFFDEMIAIEKKQTMNRMKSWLAAPPKLIRINKKYAQPFAIPNVVNSIIFTNYPDAINLDDTDRRFWVHECVLGTPRPQSYYDALWAWYDAGGAEKVIGWLMQRDISAFNPFAPPPVTDAKREMINLSLSMPARWVCDQFSEGERYEHRKIVMISEPVKAARDYNSGAPRGVNYKSAAVALKAKGFVKAQRIDVNGDRRQLWVRDPSGLLITLSADQLRERYLLELNGSTMGKAA